jgi:Fic family protein
MPPPFRLTPRVLDAMSRIDRALGRLEGLSVTQPQPQLRKRNRVRSVHASAAIEGNTLTEGQVTALLEGKRVIGAEKDVREILNVNEAYERLPRWNPTSREHLLRAHGLLMKELMPNAGRFRTSGVGVFRGDKLAHLAPPAHLVATQVSELLRWAGRVEAPALVVGCVVHYELLFIHPFLDGNGRLARLWQQVLHRRHSELLQFVPVESIIRSRQSKYYAALRASDRGGDCTPFLEFSLDALATALDEFGRDVRPAKASTEDRLGRARAEFARRWFTRADYLALQVQLSTATASRDLAAGVKSGALETRGQLRMTEYRFTPSPRA